MNKDILVCGVGGQGTVLASKLIASAYMAKGETVHSAETIGMAQRGGSVTSHVRIGEAYSPLIAQGGADIILAFEPAEAVRNLAYLKKGDIANGILTYRRKKTGQQLFIRWEKCMQEIIKLFCLSVQDFKVVH